MLNLDLTTANPPKIPVILSEAFYSGVEGPAFRVFPCMREKRVILSEAYFSGVEGPAFRVLP